MAKVIRKNGMSTERTARKTIPPLSVVEISFADTNPNMFYIANNAAAILSFSVSSQCSATYFDMLVPTFATKPFARMDGVYQVFVFNQSSTITAEITLVSWEVDDLDPSALPQTQEIVGASAAGLLGIIDINNILTALPAGSNTIGNVGLAAALPVGDNVVGRVKVTDGTTVAGVDSKTGGIVEIDVAHAYTHRKMTFSHFQRNAALAAGGTILAEINVPVNREMHLKAVRAWIGGGSGHVELIEAPTLTTGATAGVIACRNRIPTLGPPQVGIKTNPTGISGGTTLDDYQFGGASGTASGDVIEDQIEWVLNPGTTYLLRVTNDSTGTEKISVKLFWYEHPV